MTNTPLTIVLFTVAAVLVIFIGIIIAGQVARRILASKFPSPGTLIDSGDHRLHVNCQGEGPVTILLESGLNDFSIYWRQVQSLLSKHTKTCSYDRAGLGWSELGKQPSTIQNMVDDLDKVVNTVSPGAPLILVGHSYGGILVRAFAVQHPENIQAIVLVDPANEYMAERIPGYQELLNSVSGQFNKLATLASIGLMSLLTGKIPAIGLTGKDLEAYRAVLAFGQFFSAAASESSNMVDNLHAMQKISENETIKCPVIIISQGQSEPVPDRHDSSEKSLQQNWAALQADLVKRLGAKQIIAEHSGHHIQIDEPELLYKTIRSLIKND